MARSLNFAILAGLAFSVAAPAATIDVTASEQVMLGPNSTLLFDIGSTYTAHAAAGSPYPGEIDLLVGGMQASGIMASIPGTSATYTTGVLVQGTLESADGSISVPLFDANAARLGLAPGDLLLGTGYRNSAAYSGPMSFFAGTVALSSARAAELFASGNVVLRLRNVGATVALGYTGSPIGAALSASFTSADGTLSVGGFARGVQIHQAPEPGTVALLLLGLAILAPRILAQRTIE
ncbi:MAG: hypothetical protein U0Q18_15440 [Bryobacteraceae bacterium]